jgi:hypothetical protein
MVRIAAALILGLVLARRRRPADADVIERGIERAVGAAAAREFQSGARQGRHEFGAGVALGLFGNATVSLIAGFAGPTVASFLILATVAVACLAYADTALRGSDWADALIEAIALGLVAISLFLSLVTGIQLAGVCSACLPTSELLAAAAGYMLAAAAVTLVRWQMARVLG